MILAEAQAALPAWMVGVLVFASFIVALLAVRGVGNGRPHS